MGWRIINIENPCTIKTFNNNLIVFMDNKKTIPISDIDVLLIETTQATISISAINELVNSGVCIITCNNQHLPNSYILGYKVQKQSLINFNEQLKWDELFKKRCWNWIIHIKINNQLDLLKYYGINTSQYDELIQQNDLTIDLLEAKVASFFFKQLYGSSFNREKDNLINKLLNYGYIIITNMVARSIVKKGLSANIAFYHGSIYSQFPLAYDIVEIFRVVIDLFVSTMYKDELLDNEIGLSIELKRCILDFIANYKIIIDGKYEFINNSIDKVIDWIIQNKFYDHSIKYDLSIDMISKDSIDETQSIQELEI